MYISAYHIIELIQFLWFLLRHSILFPFISLPTAPKKNKGQSNLSRLLSPYSHTPRAPRHRFKAWQELQRRMHSSVARLEPRGRTGRAAAPGGSEFTRSTSPKEGSREGTWWNFYSSLFSSIFVGGEHIVETWWKGNWDM